MPLKPERNLYEYAVVRYVPSVERGEFVNVGLVMMCKRGRWLRCRFNIDEGRLDALFPGCESDCLSDSWHRSMMWPVVADRP